MQRAVAKSAAFWVGHRLTFPVAAALGLVAIAASVWSGTAVAEFAPAMLAGATFLAGAMVTVLLRVWDWADVNDSMIDRLEGDIRNEQPLRDALRQRLDSLERVQTVSAVATAVSVVLILALIVAVVNPPVVNDAVQPPRTHVPLANLLATHAAVGLAAAIAIFLLGIVAETVHVGSHSLKGSRTELAAQSGPNG